MTTYYSVTDIIALAHKFQGAGSIAFYSATVPSSTMTLDSVSYVVTDQAAWTDMMQRVNAGADPNDETVVTPSDSQVAPEVAVVGDGTADGGEGDSPDGAAGSEPEGGAAAPTE